MPSDWDLLEEAFRNPRMWGMAGGIVLAIIVLLIVYR
jgi:hypothetical protein